MSKTKLVTELDWLGLDSKGNLDCLCRKKGRFIDINPEYEYSNFTGKATRYLETMNKKEAIDPDRIDTKVMNQIRNGGATSTARTLLPS